MNVREAEVMRQWLQARLTLQGPGDVEGGYVEGSDRVVRTNQRRRDRVLLTIFGEVVVGRTAHRARGTTASRSRTPR